MERDLSRLTESERDEFLNFVGFHFSRGITSPSEIAVVIKTQFEEDPQTCSKYLATLDKLRQLDALSKLAHAGRFAYVPPEEERLKRELEIRHAQGLAGRHLTVVPTAAADVFTDAAADAILEAINRQAAQAGRGRVHVGFAGGRTLRSVASHLAHRLRTDPESAPYLKELVLHSLVAAFEDADKWDDDPNSFITYFVEPNSFNCRIKHVKMQVPAIVERSFFNQIKNRPEFRRPFEQAKKISILVTSGSLWRDPYSIVKTQLRIFAKRTWRGKARGEDLIRALDEQQVIGDLLWHPLTAKGLVDLEKLEYRIATVIDLIDVPKLIQRPEGLTSIVVLGCSGRTSREKSPLANAILRLPPEKQVFTHMLLDAPTARGLLAPPKKG